MAYLTKDEQGLIQLWNNKPEWNGQCFAAWIEKGYNNEVGIDVTSNNYFREVFEYAPCILDIYLTYKEL